MRKRRKDFRPYKEAKKWARQQNLPNVFSWRKLVNKNKIPNDIARCPEKTYRKYGWISWIEFLGLDRNPSKKFRKKICRSFEEAKKYCRKNGISSEKQWVKLFRWNRLPKDLPGNPEAYYFGQWKGWFDFHNVKQKPTQTKDFAPYEKAKQFMIKNNIKTSNEWKEFKKNNKKEKIKYWIPDNIPREPNQSYALRGVWKGWGDYTGTGTLHNSQKKFVDYFEAKKYCLEKKIVTKNQWVQHIKRNEKPIYIPSRPDATYKNKGWISWGDFFEQFNRFNRHHHYTTFKQAKKFARSCKLNYGREWMELCKSRQKPDNIPANIAQTYKAEFKGWGEFLGTGRISVQRYKDLYPTFKKLKRIVKKHNVKNCLQYVIVLKKLRKKGIFLPWNPQRNYKEWESWNKFLDRKEYIKLDDARNIVQRYKFKSQAEFRKAHSNGLIPNIIPYHPERVYSKAIM